MDLPTLVSVVVGFFLIAFGSDLARALFELLVNLRNRKTVLPREVLSTDRAAIVIPCHNSAKLIEATINTLPEGYRVYCVANNCTDNTADVIKRIARRRPEVELIDVDYPGKSKTKAALLGAIQASEDGYTHFLLLDDDVLWPDRRIEVVDESVAVTAVPVLPVKPGSLVERLQVFEYVATNLNKRCQMLFARDVTWASGAAAVYRCDVFLEVMRLHDGEFAGEDVQCSYLHHYMGYKIGFLPDLVVTTQVPRTPQAWWRQRSHSWDVSFMFLHVGLLFRVLFRTRDKGPGWWIRLMTFYRLYDTMLVLGKLAMPFVLWRVPQVSLIFFASVYTLIGMQYLGYSYFFPSLRREWGGVEHFKMAGTFLLLPFYVFATFVSRLNALPRAIHKKMHPLPLLGEFIDLNFLACTRASFWGASIPEKAAGMEREPVLRRRPAGVRQSWSRSRGPSLPRTDGETIGRRKRTA